jgi:tRNA U34 2-thiouridine synthase MnmA/TrmU
MKKALLLFSGGLDSILAGKIIQEQGIEVIPVTYITPFFNWKYSEQPELFHQRCQSLGFEKGILVNLTEEFLKILHKPRYGFGCLANPCIACKILMLSKTKQLLKEHNADFIITGEVVGQRPKSQNKRAMEIIRKESGVEDILVRPLSAKILPPTVPEKLAWVDRNKLFGFQGRSRKLQFFLARKYEIKDFPTPAGGCLLTQPEIGTRMLTILKGNKPLNELTAKLAVLGRHFIDANHWIVLGRNDVENRKIFKIANGKLPLFTLTEPAPVAVILDGNPDENLIKELLVRFSKKAKIKKESGEKVDLIPPDERDFGDNKEMMNPKSATSISLSARYKRFEKGNVPQASYTT